MIQIVKSKNEYYIKDEKRFFGFFHSVADAEKNISCRYNDFKHYSSPLKKFSIVKTVEF